MSVAVLISLCFLILTTAVCVWLWRKPMIQGYGLARAALVRRVDPQPDRGSVPLDDQPAWLIADLARRLADRPPRS